MRTVVYKEKPAFVAADVCAIIGLGNIAQAVARLDHDQKGIISVDTLGGPQEMLVVTESGFYQLVLTSWKPEARRFSRWVTDIVLPEIRTVGSYNAGPASGATCDTAHLAAENRHLATVLEDALVQGKTDRNAVNILLADLRRCEELARQGVSS